MRDHPNVSPLRLAILGAAWCFVMLAFAAANPACAKEVRLKQIDQAHITMTWEGDGAKAITVTGETAKSLLQTLAAGDTVSIPDDTQDKVDAANVKIATQAVSGTVRTVVMFVLAVVFGLLVWGFSGSVLVGVDKRYSNSKCQATLWFGAVAVTYLTTIALRFYCSDWDPYYLVGVDIPANLLALTGLTVATAGGAKATSGLKAKSEAPNAPTWSDLLEQLSHSDTNNAAGGRPATTAKLDVGDIQMLLVTGLAVIVFVVAVWFDLAEVKLAAHVALPDVSTTLTSVFGASLGGYLAKKIGSKAGEG